MAADTCCPQGHEAVTCNEEEPADEVQILIRSAARIVDKVTGKVWQSGKYSLLLFSRDDEQLCESRGQYTWEEALKLAELFKGRGEKRALELWHRKLP